MNGKAARNIDEYTHSIFSRDETKVIVWNNDDDPALILDIISGETIASIVGRYDSYAWFDKDTKIMAHDHTITVILDATTGKIIRFVEAYR